MNRAGDGYPAFQKEYGFKFASARPMQIGLVYDALKIKIRCCCWLFNRWTYCCLRFENLKDDRKFFPPYDGSPLATEKLIKDHPEIDKALKNYRDKLVLKKCRN